MPTPKKQSANWRIAALYLLIAGFAVPIVGGISLTFLHYYALPILSDTMQHLLGSAESVMLIYIGVVLGGRYISKKYRIADVSSIVNLSTAYMVVLSGLWMSADAFFLSQLEGVSPIATVIASIEAVLTIAVFYFASKKYIRAN